MDLTFRHFWLHFYTLLCSELFATIEDSGCFVYALFPLKGALCHAHGYGALRALDSQHFPLDEPTTTRCLVASHSLENVALKQQFPLAFDWQLP